MSNLIWSRARSVSRQFVLAVLCTGLAVVARPQESKKCAEPTPVVDRKFQPGQVWGVKGRSWEPDATATVLRVETMPKIGVVIHVRIEHVVMHTCPETPAMTSILHLPIGKDAFDRSVINLIRSNQEIPDFKEGYDDWRAHCGGVYSIDVSGILAVNEKTVRTHGGCES